MERLTVCACIDMDKSAEHSAEWKSLIQRMHTAQFYLYDILEQAHTIFFQGKISEQSLSPE